MSAHEHRKTTRLNDMITGRPTVGVPGRKGQPESTEGEGGDDEAVAVEGAEQGAVEHEPPASGLYTQPSPFASFADKATQPADPAVEPAVAEDGAEDGELPVVPTPRRG